MQSGRARPHILPSRMGSRPEIARHLRHLAIAAAFAGGVATAGCSIVLETDPRNCRTDADCARHANAACDSARRICVVRQPTSDGLDAGGDADAASGGDAGSDGREDGGALTCELSFDNRVRIRVKGPDGGLRPLPEAP